jgi:hypothetical protein
MVLSRAGFVPGLIIMHMMAVTLPTFYITLLDRFQIADTLYPCKNERLDLTTHLDVTV